jgi:PAS domain S-box-containing protein
VAAGAVLFGYDEETSADPERDRALVEIARVLRNARLIQTTLQQQKVFAEVFSQSADALLIAGNDARVLKWNRSAEELFGWPAAEIVRRETSILAPDDRKAESAEIAARLLAQGRLLGFETVRRRKDGVSVAVDLTATALRDDDGAPFGALISYRDITKRKELDRLKSEFMALVSHELRTPLTAIRGFAETIFDFWDEITGEQRRQYLQIILNESKRLSTLVTDFLDITRLEGGGFEPESVPVDLRGLFERLGELFKENSAKAAVKLEVLPGAETLVGDPESLYRLLVNLAGNALKYSPAGGVVTVSAAPDGDAVLLAVRDQGPGIAPADREKLFTKFFRAGDAVSRRTPGTGLGLAICKGIVDAHGGRIWVESEPGRGAAFLVRLPKKAR